MTGIYAAFLCASLAAGGAAIDAYPQPGTPKPLAGYRLLVVEKFTVEKNAATKDLPAGSDAELQKSVVARLREKKIFDEVIDGAENPAAAVAAKEAQRLLLSGTVIAHGKGSRLKRRLIGFGAGATKVKVRFLFRDAATSRELFRTDRQGTFYGMLIRIGGNKQSPIAEAENDVVDGLIKDVLKHR